MCHVKFDEHNWYIAVLALVEVVKVAEGVLWMHFGWILCWSRLQPVSMGHSSDIVIAEA